MSQPCKSYFDALGGEWDRLREDFFTEALREKALDAAGVARGRIAVDVGAGTGFVTGGLLARGLQVVAVDQSAAMLDALRSKLGVAGRVDCRVGEATALPLDDGSADYCFANMLLHHVEHPDAALREMARVVRPGGRIVVTDLDTHDHDFLRTEHHDRWSGFRRDGVAKWFRRAGLTGVTVDSAGEQCCATSCNGSLAVVGIFLATGTVPRS